MEPLVLGAVGDIGEATTSTVYFGSVHFSRRKVQICDSSPLVGHAISVR
jgi:hypothetical protein